MSDDASNLGIEFTLPKADLTTSVLEKEDFEEVPYGKDGGADDVAKKMAESGMDKDYFILKATNTTLQIDIDHPYLSPTFYEIKSIIEEHIKITDMVITPSKSGNLHVIITLEKALTANARILLQAALGSDGKREVLNFIRTHNFVKDPVLLIERKEMWPQLKGIEYDKPTE